MKPKRCGLLVVSIVSTFVIGACSPNSSTQTLPAVSDENCKAENITKMVDKGSREKLSSMCVSRGQFKPSPKKEW